ncbi:MAG: glycosyltransferase N-terminal domain-containing protein [Pseudomonadota bacterium]
MNHKSPGFAYRLISHLLLPFWLIHAIRHGYKRKLAQYLPMRLGFRSAKSLEETIWIHASSVGEVHSISPLLEALIAQGQTILFTGFTATGFQTIQSKFGSRVEAGIIPIDCWWLCRRFFDNRQIKLAVIMETELWPELLYQCDHKQIPLIQVNARLSAKSADQPRLVRRLLKNTLGYFDRILTRSETDLNQLLAMGADAERIEIVGNIKTIIPDPEDEPPKRLLQENYILLASSHPGEEFAFLESCNNQLPDQLIVIAPRHPERSDKIQQEMAALGFEFAVRSKDEKITAQTRVYLADTLGEMKALMAHARLVIMGGSFDHTGGHNIIEPASLGCCIITGPSDSNIQLDIAMLENGRGILQVNNMDECWKAVTDLLENPWKAEKMANEAASKLARQPDIIGRYVAALQPWYS